jgi:hypothetical protein
VTAVAPGTKVTSTSSATARPSSCGDHGRTPEPLRRRRSVEIANNDDEGVLNGVAVEDLTPEARTR